MRRGTTPTHTFTLPLDASLISKLRILYAQGGKVILTKTEADGVLDSQTISIKLTQEETLKFRSSSTVEIQMRILTVGGDALASEVDCISCKALLEDEVIA